MMLKPTVACALLWLYDGGLLLTLIGLVILAWRCRDEARALPLQMRGGVLVLASVWAATAILALALDLFWLFFAHGMVCVMLCGCLLPIRRAKPWTWLVMGPPLGLMLWAAYGLGQIALDTQGEAFIPVQEQRLSPALACRNYPHNVDSYVGTRVVLVRVTGDWFRDEVVDSLVGGSTCTLLPDGSVLMASRTRYAAGPSRKHVPASRVSGLGTREQ